MNLQTNPSLTLYLLMISLIIGSFLNVVIYRLPRHLSFLKGFSFCPFCQHYLSWKEKIPIFSYLYLKGRCYHCGKVINPLYPLIESSSLVLMTICLWLPLPLSLQLLHYLFFCTLLCIAAIDIDTMEIHDGFHRWIFLLGCCHLILDFQISDRVIGLLILSLPLALTNFLFPNSLGGGDVKLAFSCGFYLGSKVLFGGMIAFILGGFWIIYLILRQKAYPKMQIPLAPFLGLGFLICTLSDYVLPFFTLY